MRQVFILDFDLPKSQGHVMSLKCAQSFDEVTFKVKFVTKY